MGLGKKIKPMGAFCPISRKKSRKLREEFLGEEVFGLTGKRIKRSKGFR